jgi:hypothetical protein
MPTIATTGSGDGLRIITNTLNDVTRVSCLCCGCAGVPDEITVVFSGIILCPHDPAFPATIATAILTRDPDGGFSYNDGDSEVRATCYVPSFIVENLPELIPDIPEGVDLNSSTPLFIISYRATEGGSGGGEDNDGSVFSGRFAINGGTVFNRGTATVDDCDNGYNWAYGGTATLSWE